MVRTVIVVANMACVSTDLDCALSYALQRLGTPNLILKPEQRSVIESICNGKDTFVWLPTGFGKLICSLPFVFDKMSRKCAAGGSVVVVVSPLISLMEDQLANLRKWGVNAAIVQPCDHADVICTLPLMNMCFSYR